LAIGIGDKQFQQELPRWFAKYGAWEDIPTAAPEIQEWPQQWLMHGPAAAYLLLAAAFCSSSAKDHGIAGSASYCF
jgi:hypothetical protein